MPAGSYELEFTDCELGRYATEIDHVTLNTGDVIKVDAALELAAGHGGVAGVVSEAGTGDALVEFCVKLYEAGDDILVAYTYTDSDGAYQLVAPAGEYRLRFKACESDSHTEQWYDGADGWSDSTPIVVTSGTYLTGIDAELTPNPHAETVAWGYVVNGDTGLGVHGYCVSLYAGDDKIKTVLTGEAGGWELATTAGEYRVKTWACEGHEDLGTVWYLDGEGFETADVVSLDGGVMQLDTLVVGDVRFRDALESSFHEDIVWLAEHGITLGCNRAGTEFCPNDAVTRAQMAAFLHRALGHLLSGDDAPAHFDDVVHGSTFAADIQWLASVGITLGCNTDGTKFCPDEPVSRAQMAAFLHRALADILVSDSPAGFVDDDGSTFESDIEWLASVGITTGCDSGGTKFCPEEDVIRAHMAAFLHRALGDG